MRRRDDGSVSILCVASVIVATMIIAMLVDGSGQIRARQRATDIAAEAARAGAQGIDLDAAIRGAKKKLDEHRAQDLATAYLATMGAKLVSITFNSTDTQVTVTVALDFKAAIMPLFNQTVNGTATAILLQVNENGAIT